MKMFTSAYSLQPTALVNWLPDMDLNHDKQIQSLLCYRYTIGQAGALGRLNAFSGQSSRQTGSMLKEPNGFNVRPHPDPLLGERVGVRADVATHFSELCVTHHLLRI